jgi:2-methylisocitrate lyase-like PEP mutase family enzyme
MRGSEPDENRPPERLRALLAQPGFVTMPAVWDGLSAKLAAEAGFETAFLSAPAVRRRASAGRTWT